MISLFKTPCFDLKSELGVKVKRLCSKASPISQFDSDNVLEFSIKCDTVDSSDDALGEEERENTNASGDSGSLLPNDSTLDESHETEALPLPLGLGFSIIDSSKISFKLSSSEVILNSGVFLSLSHDSISHGSFDLPYNLT